MVAFFDTAGSMDHAWLLFIMITLVSSMFGKNIVFQRIGIPIITGYMIIGFFCGPYVFGLMTQLQVSELKYVNQAALSFIAVSAGAEIYLPEIMPLIRPIMWISCSMIFFTMFIGTLFTYGVGGTPLLPWLVGWNPCNFGVSMLVATILSARSPTSVLAVVRELQARGEVTSTIIGITVAGDVFVLTIFAIVQAMTSNFCSGAAFDVATFFVNLVLIPVAVLWGWLFGQLLVQMLRFEQLKHLILPLGFLNYLICDYILAVSTATGKFEIDIDALLICITAGFVAGNSEHREKLVEYLKSLSMYVFIPFFTQVGLQLNLPVLVQALGFSIVASLVRAFCMMCGTYTGGIKAGMAPDKALRLWMGLIPQAGVALGLAGIVGQQFQDTFGPSFQSTVLGIILTNQVIGPIGAKYLIKYAKEDGQGGGEDDEHGLKHTIAAFNDGHIDTVEVNGVEMLTQTEEALFTIAAGGSSSDYVPEPMSYKDDTDASATDNADASEGGSALEEVVLGVIRPFHHGAHRRGSVARVPERPLKFVAPRSRQATKGGYASLDSPGDGDVEMQGRTRSKKGKDVSGGEAVNPLWQDGEEGQKE